MLETGSLAEMLGAETQRHSYFVLVRLALTNAKTPGISGVFKEELRFFDLF